MIQGVMDTVISQAHEHGVKKVTLIKLLVGKLTGAYPKALEFGFDVLKTGTELAEAELKITEIKPEFSCPSCGWTFASDTWAFSCEKCGGFCLKAVQGEELIIDSFEGI